MTTQPIKSLFANDIHRRIEEVIKVDQTSDDILRDEINEYVVTDAIRLLAGIFDAFRETPNKPHEGIAIWVSGFFGSVNPASRRCSVFPMESVCSDVPTATATPAGGDNKLQVLLGRSMKIPTHAVIFDVSTDQASAAGTRPSRRSCRALPSEPRVRQGSRSFELELRWRERKAKFEEEYRRLFGKMDQRKGQSSLRPQ
jgi:hypothetical protein